MNFTATTLATLKAGQQIFAVLSVLQPDPLEFPPNYEPKDNEKFDYIIIGGGTSGSILANRLTESGDVSVLVIEAGTDPGPATEKPGFFPFTAESSYDYNFPTVKNDKTGQLLRGQSVRVTAGKMLGGSSAMNHFLDIRGNTLDFSRWAAAAGDNSWDYKALLPYFIKYEKVTNKTILDSSTGVYHGTDGNVGLTIEHIDANNDIIKAFKELGYEYNLDINSYETLGITEPFYNIFNGKRTDMARSYLTPAKNRKSLHVWKNAVATQIIFDDKKNAVSVKVMNSKKKNFTVNAKKEIILSAGVIKSPQLLMVSGIGPASHLKEFGIKTLSDLPVGTNLQDHVAVMIVHKLEKSNAIVVARSPSLFPNPYLLVNVAVDPSSSIPDYQSINLVIPHDTDSLALFCGVVLKYDSKVCSMCHDANVGRTILLAAVYKHRPLSTGEVRLNSKDPLDNPIINMNYYSNPKDLEDMVSYVQQYTKVVNTTVFKNRTAEFLDMNIDQCKDFKKGSPEYWKCYILNMSTTIYSFVGTCALGTVLDTRLRVRGVNRLRVVDASAMPTVPSGDNMAALIAFTEKAADLIKEDDIK